METVKSIADYADGHDHGNVGQDRKDDERFCAVGKSFGLYKSLSANQLKEKDETLADCYFEAQLNKQSPAQERMMVLNKAIQDGAALVGVDGSNASAQGRMSTKNWAFIVPHPYNREFLKNSGKFNPHHNTCMQVTVNAAVGLGFETEEQVKEKEKVELNGGVLTVKPSKTLSKEEKILGPLCHMDGSFQHLLHRITDDLIKTGESYMEVVLDTKSRNVLGLYFMPSEKLWLMVEDRLRNFHYTNSTMTSASYNMHFARFGDFDRFLEASVGYKPEVGFGWGITAEDKALLAESHSEIIRFQMPTSSNEWYGLPAWLPAIYIIEILKSLGEYRYSFFRNNGVPSVLLTLLGFTDGSAVTTLKKEMENNVGADKAFKTYILKSSNPDASIQVDKLLGEGHGNDGLEEEKKGYASDVVTAHRVPPLLAGILIPGKLGGTNEFPNALLSFQNLVIDQIQHNICTVMRNTLGNTKLVSNLGLDPDDFVFNKVSDFINMQSLDTMGRMRETLPEANAKGRKLSEGVKD